MEEKKHKNTWKNSDRLHYPTIEHGKATFSDGTVYLVMKTGWRRYK